MNESIYTVTPRESEVLSCITKGYPSPQIARELSIDICTVKTHLTKLFLKFGVDNRTQLAIKAHSGTLVVIKHSRKSF